MDFLKSKNNFISLVKRGKTKTQTFMDALSYLNQEAKTTPFKIDIFLPNKILIDFSDLEVNFDIQLGQTKGNSTLEGLNLSSSTINNLTCQSLSIKDLCLDQISARSISLTNCELGNEFKINNIRRVNYLYFNSIPNSQNLHIDGGSIGTISTINCFDHSQLFSNISFKNIKDKNIISDWESGDYKYKRCIFFEQLHISEAPQRTQDITFDQCEFKKTILISSCNLNNLHFRGIEKAFVLEIEKSIICELALNNTSVSSLTVSESSIGKPFEVLSQSSIRVIKLDKLTLNSPVAIEGQQDLERLTIENCNLNNNSLEIKNSHCVSLKVIDEKSSGSIRIYDSTFDNFIINNFLFKHQLLVQNSTFNHSPDFHGSTFYTDTDFINNIFKDVKSNECEARYRTLKRGMSNITNEVTESVFSSLELTSRFHNIKFQIRYFPETFFSLIYIIINQHGKNVFLPLLWIFYVIIISPFIYVELFQGNIDYNTNLQWAVDLDYINSVLVQSMINSISPLRLFLREPLFFSQNFNQALLISGHLVLSSILWFFLILGIRRRFRSK